ncbi:MAG: helix-turn-helix domain-containing protein, partial [Nevskiaceae bacterium]
MLPARRERHLCTARSPPGERYTLGALHTQGFNQAEIARILGRHPSTIGRELKRNRTRY